MAFRRSGVRPSLAPPRFPKWNLDHAEDAQKAAGHRPALFVSGGCANSPRNRHGSSVVSLSASTPRHIVRVVRRKGQIESARRPFRAEIPLRFSASRFSDLFTNCPVFKGFCEIRPNKSGVLRRTERVCFRACFDSVDTVFGDGYTASRSDYMADAIRAFRTVARSP